jgi:hypothetical protein
MVCVLYDSQTPEIGMLVQEALNLTKPTLVMAPTSVRVSRMFRDPNPHHGSYRLERYGDISEIARKLNQALVYILDRRDIPRVQDVPGQTKFGQEVGSGSTVSV